MREDELQAVFDSWAGGGSRLYEIAGWPSEIRSKAGVNERRRTWIRDEFYFTPDVIWTDDLFTYVLELKSAYNYQPLVLAQALQNAEQLRLLRPDPSLLVPVLVTRYTQWLRGAIAWMIRNGFDPSALRYVEFVRLEGEGRKFLWFEEPFAQVAPSPQGPSHLASLFVGEAAYFRGAEECWYGCRSAPDPARSPPFWWDPHVRLTTLSDGDCLIREYRANERRMSERQNDYYLARLPAEGAV